MGDGYCGPTTGGMGGGGGGGGWCVCSQNFLFDAIAL